MKKTIFTLSFAMLTALSLSISANAGDHHSHGVVIKKTAVAGDIYMIEGKGGNIGFVVGEKNIFVIDSQFAEVSAQVKAEIAATSSKPVSFLLNTHFHGDHTGGNKNFAKNGVQIIAHKNVRERLEAGSALPVLTYTDSGVSVYTGEEAELVHYPNAHTDGDTAVFFKKSNVIHTGDIFFNGRYPFIDEKSGGSVDGYLAAMQAILDRADSKTKIIPGHGELADKAKMTQDLAILKDTIAAIKGGIKKGLDNKAISQLAAVKKHSDEYGSGFISTERFINTIR